MIFSTYIRENADHKKRKETAFEFLDRSAWKISEFVRQRLNDLSKSYEPDYEFLKMFKSKSDKQHYSAVFELLTFSLLSLSKFNLVRHPETRTVKRPDFIATASSYNFFIECTLSGHSFDSSTDKNRKDTVEEIIDEIEFFPYWINLDFQTISHQSVSKRKLLSFLDNVKSLSDGFSNEEILEKKYIYEDKGWEVEILFLRKTEPNIKRSLGFISENAKTIETSKPILTALNDKKASRYGIDKEHYIICLNTNDLFTKENCFEEALFGQSGDSKIDLRYVNQHGFYLSNGKAINTSVSAVIIFRNFDVFTLDNSSISVWHNPYAKNKIPLNILPFDEHVYEIGDTFLSKTTIKKENDLFDTLGINMNEYITSKDKSSS